ncbi:MAG: efflux RND transporter permease subunit [Bacteroidota bacterium]|nr:efflux RND transporter permease subunit [Bacteroidota bacterium]MDP4229443.1 efflux RND transporter permease subunit [Bacteroidota bacterium]MDP4235394.1 efflux RND transporter permease subunit [Bacteroidota bacterium]
MTITELSIKRPAFITIVFVALAVMGLFGLSRLGTDLLPKMDWPYITVLTTYPGAGPEEIEDLVTKPIEEAVAGTSNLDNVRSFSNEGYSVVLGQYLLSANSDEAAADVQRRVDQIRSKLPKDADPPKVQKNDIGAMPILRIALSSTVLTPTELYQLAKDKLKARLESTEGVGQVEITGGRERQIKVSVDNDKLRSYNLSIVQIQQALATENLDFPTGTVKQPTDQYIVRVKGKFQSTNEIKTLPIATLASGSTIYLGDVAKVEDTYNENYKPTRLSGKDAVGINVIKTSDANANQTADNVQAMLANLTNEYQPDGIKFDIAQDATQFTRSSIREVFRDLGLAILLVSCVLFLFLRSGRNALIVLIAIPTSLVSTFIFMWVFGFTINMMSMMALSLVIGILVDDSIVVLENIHRKLDEGETPVNAAIKGRNEIGFAALAITLVDVVVFLPISLVSGITGKIFREFGLTVVVSTLMSLFVSFTLTPMLAAKFGKAHEGIKFPPLRWLSDKFERFQDWLEVKYKNILGWSLKHRWVIVTSSALLFLGSCSLVINGKIGTEFITQPDRGEFAANFDFPAGTNVETTDSLIQLYEGLLAKDSNVVRFQTVVGRQENAWGVVERQNVGQISVRLPERDKRIRSTDDEMKNVTAMAAQIPGLLIRTQPIGIFGSANQSPIQMETRGDDLGAISSYSDTLIEHIKNIPGLRDLKSSYEEGQPEVKIIFDRDRLAANNMSLGEAAFALRTALSGNTDAKYKEGETEYDINVILDRVNRSNAKDVARLTLLNHLGQQVKVSDIATLTYGKGPSQIGRKNRERVVIVYGNLIGRPLGDVVKDIRKEIAKVSRRSGISEPYFAGDAENQQRSGGDMMIAFLLAILFVYMIMVALFESYVHPFTIMFSLPVALIGALTMLWLGHKTLSIFTMVGMIMLMGLVTKNAILIVDRTNARRALGHGLFESLLEAGPTRLRPIIMTTVTMILGMLPLALGAGEGSEFRQGMAIAIIGGLTSSMLLTLLLVPVMYTFVEGWRTKFPRFFGRILFLKKFRKPRPGYAGDEPVALGEA